MGSNRPEKLATLHRGIQRCRKCRLCERRRHAVPGEGPCGATVMFIGEAPGENEDREGRPFCGRSGEFFDELLESVGIRREEVYVTSSVKCRPPGNRDPKPDELAICRQAWLEEQIAIVNPRLIVLLGKIALRQMLAETRPLREVHGRIAERDGRAVLPTYHPAAGMRFPDIDKAIRKDFGKICRSGEPLAP